MSSTTIKERQAGFAHVIALILIVVGVAALGYYAFVKSSADTVAKPPESSLRIATYNIKSSNFTPQPCSDKPVYCTRNRALKATNVIKGNNIGDKRAEQKPFDVVGVQEMQTDQFNLFDSMLPAYGHFPKRDNDISTLARTIYYRRDRLRLVDGGGVQHPFNRSTSLTDLRGTSMWVKLRDRSTGKAFYVLNTHMTTKSLAKNGPNGALIRERTARLLKNWIDDTRRKDPDTPIFLIGDMNSSFYTRNNDRLLDGNRARLPYCILSENQAVRHIYDRVQSNPGDCPTNTKQKTEASGFEIDHIFVYGSLKINDYNIMDRRDGAYVRIGSDHAPVYVDAQLGPAFIETLPPRSRLTADDAPIADPSGFAADAADQGYQEDEFSDQLD